MICIFSVLAETVFRVVVLIYITQKHTGGIGNQHIEQPFSFLVFVILSVS